MILKSLTLLSFITLLVAFDQFKPIKQTTPEEMEAQKLEDSLRRRGPKFGAGCYRVINKESNLYNCTFQSTQGSMFISENGSPMEWKLVWNRRITCIHDYGYFIGEDEVKAIECPSFLLCDKPVNGRCP